MHFLAGCSIAGHIELRGVYLHGIILPDEEMKRYHFVGFYIDTIQVPLKCLYLTPKAASREREQVLGYLSTKYGDASLEEKLDRFLEFDPQSICIVTSSIEHHSVLETCHFLEKLGFEVTYLPVEKYGRVSIDELENAVSDRSILVSIMLANNEIGTLQAISEFARLVRAKREEVVFHTGAVQAAMALDVTVDGLGVDMLSLSAHKLYGPKGVGILYIRRPTPFLSQQRDSGQERNRRVGTENVPGVVGAGAALGLAAENLDSNGRYCRKLRSRLTEGTKPSIKEARFNGHPTEYLASILNASFGDFDPDSLLSNLDLGGIMVSTGSACASTLSAASHVLPALGLSTEAALGSVRYSLGFQNTEEEIDSVLSSLPIVEKARAKLTLAERINQK